MTPTDIIVLVLALLGIVLGAYSTMRGDAQTAGLAVVLVGIALIITRGL